MKTVFLAILLFTVASGAMSTEALSKKLSFTNGLYKAEKGSDPSCISGVFKIFGADENVFHLKADESIFANNVHTRRSKSQDSSCKVEYKTKAIKNGFVNIEVMECINPEIFYSRVLKVKTKSPKIMVYSLTTQDSKKAKKKNLRCKLNLLKNY